MAISEQLREAIRASGLSANALARGCGVPQPMLTRFINGLDVRLATADKLAAYFGLELRPATEKKPVKKSTPGK
jgi:plasmid maintenance system antidote protein VapI